MNTKFFDVIINLFLDRETFESYNIMHIDGTTADVVHIR